MAKKEIETIQSLTSSAISKFLGDINSTERFTCRGRIATTSEVQLVYRSQDGSWNEVCFPGVTATDLSKIIESATFTREETDKSYYKSYNMSDFLSSFQLSESGILGEVHACLSPHDLNIRADLDKINIYSAPPGQFKALVETHVEPDASYFSYRTVMTSFGNLVVCLPAEFTGGCLVIRHNEQVVDYNWSLSDYNPQMPIQWAAFSCDMEHEVLLVTEGYCMTLTCNLYHCEIIAMDICICPFYANLKAAVNHPHFLNEEGILGFMCKCAYVYGESKETEEEFESNLCAFMKESDCMWLWTPIHLGS